jgi:D-alanyl-D-alanine carboxypeptidase
MNTTVKRLFLAAAAISFCGAVMAQAPVPETPAEFAVARLSEAELVSALGAELDEQAAAGRFAGTVLLAKDGEPIFTGEYGLADRESGVENTLQTRFRNGSMNKMFTAVAVLTLAQAGKLSLDDPIGKYLTDYPNQMLASKVTIHNLLTHTGGTGDVFGPKYAAHRLELRTHEDYVDRDLEFEPGARWMYSNYGFVLLGRIIEKVSGQSYYDYVRAHVYEPAGMTSTGSVPEDENVPNRSVGYMRAPGGRVVPNTDTLPYRGMAAGGGYTTVGDLLRFANALTNHTLLDVRYAQLLTTGKVDAGGGRYAYGFEERIVDGVKSIGHGGGAPGMNGDLRIFPDSGYVVAVLSNLDPPAAQRISDFIGNRLPIE